MAFERDYEPRTISPLGLLYGALEAALAGGSYSDAILDLTQRLDVSAGELSPISAVRHVESMAEVISMALEAKLGRMHRIDPVALGDHQWQSNLFEDRSGFLHRLILASHMDDDSLRSYAHSWGTIGELAALERPYRAADRDHRLPAWRPAAFRVVQGLPAPHPEGAAVPAAQEGRWLHAGLEGVLARADRDQSPTWLDRMRLDEVLPDLITVRRVQYRPEDERMKQARRDMLALIPRMEAVTAEEPMRRSSCDELGKGACPFQAICYSPTPVEPADLPQLYRACETLPVAPEE